jgi:hypothetical protein
MAMMYATQQQVIVALTEVGEVDLAARLERCMTGRRERRSGSGWPHICRSAVCAWCYPTLKPSTQTRYRTEDLFYRENRRPRQLPTGPRYAAYPWPHGRSPMGD